MKTGYIPDKLKVVCRKLHEHKARVGSVSAKAAFFVSANSAKSLETAKAWAEGKWKHGWYSTPDKVATPEVLDLDNNPIDKVRLVDLEVRGEGGRAFKVLIRHGEDDLLVDLREDVFLDALFANLVQVDQSNVYINGPFRWVVNSSQMRLALVDSNLYREIVKADDLKRSPKKGKIDPKDLVVGHVYTSEPDHHYPHYYIFLGHVRCRGKAALAFVDFWQAKHCDIQKRFDSELHLVTILKSSSVTTDLGPINLKPLPKNVQYQNGFGEEALAQDVVWETPLPTLSP